MTLVPVGGSSIRAVGHCGSSGGPSAPSRWHRAGAAQANVAVRRLEGLWVLNFEPTNSARFAASMSDSGDELFSHFTVRYDALLAEKDAGICVPYVLVAGDVSVPGRFKLVDIEDHAAELGYRVAKHVVGRGVATRPSGSCCRLGAAQPGLVRPIDLVVR